MRVEEFDRDARADDRMLGGVDRSHAAFSQRARDDVAADGAADQLVLLDRLLGGGRGDLLGRELVLGGQLLDFLTLGHADSGAA